VEEHPTDTIEGQLGVIAVPFGRFFRFGQRIFLDI
jgi:hypothetical protein